MRTEEGVWPDGPALVVMDRMETLEVKGTRAVSHESMLSAS